MCWALRLAFPDHPIVGYFGVPLMSYIATEEKSVLYAWLEAFNTMTNFVPVAQHAFLAEQMRYQSGRSVAVVRPLSLYIDASYEMPTKPVPEFLILRQPTLFWDLECAFTALARLNNIDITFIHSDNVNRSKSYQVWSQWDGLIFLPYETAQMFFYEFYAMGLPIFLPSVSMLPSYIYRGMVTIPDFDISIASPARDALPNPFNGHGHWPTAMFWTRATHYAQLPGLHYFESFSDLFATLAKFIEDPGIGMEMSAIMRKRGQEDLITASKFWRAALNLNDQQA